MARPIKVFLGGSFASRARLRVIARVIEQLNPNITIVSRWLYETAECCTSKDECRIAHVDREDMDKCDVMLLDTLEDSTRGSRYWETGYMVGRRKFVYLIGQPTNPYLTAFCTVKFTSWEHALLYIKHWGADSWGR